MDFQRAVLRANKEIYALLQGGLDASFYRPAKEGKEGIGFGGDQSLKIDLSAESIFIRHLSPFGRINSEECGEVGEGDDEIVIDPIDGSSNIASGFPYFGTSVSLKKNGRAAVSVVCNLANADCFVRNGDTLFKTSLQREGTLPLDAGYTPNIGLFEKAYSNPDVVSGLKGLGLKFRSPGAVALSLAYAHTVQFVLFVGPYREYDIIAGLHLCGDLHTHVDENVILVSRDRRIFEAIKELFGESYA
ncbi:MAG: inositol monophosphatase family protein [Campylobacterales bacterium]